MPKLNKKTIEADLVLEISWEVCNKIGGIYTVLKSKAGQMINLYGQNYYLIGPYFPERIKGYFEEILPPEKLRNIFSELEKEKIKCHFGKWLIEGEPKVILIDFKDYWFKINEIKTNLWDYYKIDSLGAGHDFNEPVLWASAAGILIEKIANFFPEKKIVAHFHEWLSGAGLLHLRKNKTGVATVFATHATTLGRTLAYNNVDFYSILHKINPEQEISRYNIKAKHQLEKETAKNCHVFTTVSEITSLETERFLERKPDVLLPNGLDSEKFLNFEELIIKHRVQRNKLREFLIFYFFPYYTFELEETIFYFIVGRYEFRTKGIDIFIKTLSQLNQKLIKAKSKKTIIAFFWIPTEIRSVKTELLENREIFEDIKDAFEQISWETKEKILYAILEGKKIDEKVLFEKDFLLEIKKKILKLKREGFPPLSTHELVNSQDAILKSFQENGLLNKKTDKVKVIFYPIYLTGHDGLANLNYQESLQACHLGVFPSFYEPWGYTPLETAALGVASITTDLAGFGRFCQKIEKIEKIEKYPGIFVLERFAKSDEEEIKSLADFLHKFSQFTLKERVENKIQARKIAALADWKIFIKNYLKAHNLAISKIK